MTVLKRALQLVFLSGALTIGLVAGLGLVVRQPAFGRTESDAGEWADPERLRRHVEFFSVDSVPRSWRHQEGLTRSKDYIVGEMEGSGARVHLQSYLAGNTTQENIIARFGRLDHPLVIVGAHYDVFGSMAGADDNASGVAGLLELARLFEDRSLEGAIELVAYSTEEPPWFGSDRMGSSVHARSLSSDDRSVRAMVCLEMIGYFSKEQPSQSVLVDAIYPGHGSFVVVAGRWQDRRLTRQFKRAFRGATDLQIVSYSGPTVVGTDLSDHRNYWIEGWPAVMVSDTSFLRNPNYHLPTDTAKTLDYERMAETVNGVLNAVMDLQSGK